MQGSSCPNITNCEFTIPTDTEEDDDTEEQEIIHMEWNDPSIWQGISGPQWKDANGTKPPGIPGEGASVVIPDGIECYFSFLCFFLCLYIFFDK